MKILTNFAALVLLMLAGSLAGQAQTRLYGDVNSDSEVTLADVNAVINVILGGSAPTPPPDPNGHEYVDLGLPSGTLWATCNVGASSPEEYGSYFAWGETSPKSNYQWKTYKWCIFYKEDEDGYAEYDLTKYCANSYYGIVDFKAELEPEDDAAYVNWGPLWRMPSKVQFREIEFYCTWTWTQKNGVNGLMVTGPNGNTLFFPAAGFRRGSSLEDAGEYVHSWSRTLNTHHTISAWAVENSDWEDSGADREEGYTVRAVRASQN